MYADQFPNTASRCRTGVCSGFDSRDIATNNGSDKAGADLFITDKLYIRGLYHCVGSLDHGHEAFTLNHS
jgi:hypothetical protein